MMLQLIRNCEENDFVIQKEGPTMSLSDWRDFWNRHQQSLRAYSPLQFAKFVEESVFDPTLKPEVVKLTLGYLIRSVAALFDFSMDLEVSDFYF